MTLSIGEAARLCGVSPRTLRHYDRIGLVKAAYIGENGYRYYDDHTLALLQQVLFYRELGLSLKEIGPLLQASQETRFTALRAHRELLLLQKKRLEGLLELVERTLKGEAWMKQSIVTAAELADKKAQYAQEARRRWGETREWQAWQARQDSPAEEAQAQAGAEEIFSLFAALAAQKTAGNSPEATALAARWQDHISRWYFPCSREVLAGLGKMYGADRRFADYLDGFGPGTAKLMEEAIGALCDRS